MSGNNGGGEDHVAKQLRLTIKHFCKSKGNDPTALGFEMNAEALRNALVMVKNMGPIGSLLAWENLQGFLNRDDSTTRYLALLLTNELFKRSKSFRNHVCLAIREFVMSVLDIPGFSTLPKPVHAKALLHKTAKETLVYWTNSFGKTNPQLQITMKFLRSKMDFESEQLFGANHTSASNRQHMHRLLMARYHAIVEEITDSTIIDSINNAAYQVKEILELMQSESNTEPLAQPTKKPPLMSEVTTDQSLYLKKDENDDNDDEVDPDIAEWEAFERAQEETEKLLYTLENAPPQEPVLRLELHERFKDNHPLFLALKDIVIEIKSNLLPTIRRWIHVLVQVENVEARDRHLQLALRLKSSLLDALSQSTHHGFHIEAHQRIELRDFEAMMQTTAFSTVTVQATRASSNSQQPVASSAKVRSVASLLKRKRS